GPGSRRSAAERRERPEQRNDHDPAKQAHGTSVKRTHPTATARDADMDARRAGWIQGGAFRGRLAGPAQVPGAGPRDATRGGGEPLYRKKLRRELLFDSACSRCSSLLASSISFLVRSPSERSRLV